jgi:septum formation protein
MAKYILASASPRRKQLLEWAEIDFEIIVAHTDESYPVHLPPEEIAIHIAQEKAKAVQEKTGSDRTIIAADTIVVLNDEIIGKPKDKEDAFAILSKLSGKAHQVITGVVILGKKDISFADITEVEFYPLSIQQIEFYIDKYKPYDKAGAYAIQEWIGVTGIKRINGDFYNVMGLPISRVVQALQNGESMI